MEYHYSFPRLLGVIEVKHCFCSLVGILLMPYCYELKSQRGRGFWGQTHQKTNWLELRGCDVTAGKVAYRSAAIEGVKCVRVCAHACVCLIDTRAHIVKCYIPQNHIPQPQLVTCYWYMHSDYRTAPLMLYS